ncbi:hypothetical protein ACKC5Q_15590, partial [Aeromonas dhakensis]|uniref:hypothetical protein n=1 Tax=Aeromonas dhakensis TaxID=196024 RepID=UPI0038B6A397
TARHPIEEARSFERAFLLPEIQLDSYLTAVLRCMISACLTPYSPLDSPLPKAGTRAAIRVVSAS